MKIVQRLLGLSTFVIGYAAASATPVTGIVADAETGEAIIGATIYDVTEKKGVISDLDGHFSIDIHRFPSELQISYVGYQPKQARVTARDTTYNIRLVEEDHRLDEVVVVGYGTQKRTQLTGSVTTVRSDVFENSVAPTFDAALGDR